MLPFLSALLASAFLPAASSMMLAYDVPQELRALSDSCNYPSSFAVHNLSVFTPAQGNQTVEFTFIDNGTAITALCQLNATSVRTNPNSYNAPRYACNHPAVTFIWDSEEKDLAVIEEVCPEQSSGFEATGSVIPEYQPAPDGCPSVNSTRDGQCETSTQAELRGRFVSLSPKPRDPPPPSSRARLWSPGRRRAVFIK